MSVIKKVPTFQPLSPLLVLYDLEEEADVILARLLQLLLQDKYGLKCETS